MSILYCKIILWKFTYKLNKNKQNNSFTL